MLKFDRRIMFENINPKENLSPEDGYGAIEEIPSDESTPFIVVKDIEERFPNRKSKMTAFFLFVAAIGVFAFGEQQTESSLASASAVGVGGCDVTSYVIHMWNYMDTPMTPYKYDTTNGNVNFGPCGTFSGNTDFPTSCGWFIDADDGTHQTNSFSTATTDACQGVGGSVTLTPSSDYTDEFGLNSIQVVYGNTGGPNGILTHYLQYDMQPEFNTFTTSQIQPYQVDCPGNNENCNVWFNFEAPVTSAPTATPEFTSYEGKWNEVAVDASVTLSQSVSWQSGQSSTIGSSFSYGFSECATVGFGGSSASVGASQSSQSSTSTTVGETSGGSTTATCSSTVDCSGALYQWQVTGTPTFGTDQTVTTCDFTCVPDSVPNGPKCPLGSCENTCCQCCNQAWIEGTTVSDPNNFASTAIGGTCSFDCSSS